MPPRSSPVPELLRLYALAATGEHNLARFLDDEPALALELGVSPSTRGDRDDASLALELAPVIGRMKARATRRKEADRVRRAETAARGLKATAVHEAGRVVIEADVLLGDALADPKKKYIGLETGGEQAMLFRRSTLLAARMNLRIFLDLGAFVDAEGLHFVWRAGRGRLNLRPQALEREADVLVVDLRRPEPVRRVERRQRAPALLGDIVAELGL